MKKTILFILFFVGAIRLFAQELKLNVAVPSCGILDDNIDPSVLKLIREATIERGNARRAAENLREIRFAIVVDSTVYFQYKQDTSLIKESAYRRFREASKIYERDFGVRLNITSFEFLKKNNKYNDLNMTRNAYAKFVSDYQNRNDIKRDILALWSVYKNEPYAGIASFPTFQGVGQFIHLTSYPNSEIAMGMLLHEIGHTMGSTHTQSCLWAGGPFEVCAAVEGTCKNWATDSRYASIMSYCIDGASFFHPLCKDVIQNIANTRLQIMSAAPATSPVLQFPQNNKENFYPSDFFTWKSVEKVNNYQVLISENADFSNPMLDSLVSESMAYISKTFKRNTTYFWRVRAKNQVGDGAWSATSTFKTNQNLTLKAPISALISTDKTPENMVIDIKPVTDAKEYIIEFHKGYAITATSFHSEKKVNTTKVRVETILPSTSNNYYNNFLYRIRSVSDTTKSAWSNVLGSFYYTKTTTVSLGAIKTPINTYISTNIVLPLASQKYTYDYEISKTSDFKTPEIKKQIQHDYYFQTPSTQNYATLPAENLSPNQLYYYRVKAKNEVDSINAWVNGQFTTSYESRWKTMHSGNSILPFPASSKGLFIDKNNNKWIFGSMGVFKQSLDGKIEHFTRERTSDLLANTVNEIAEDDQGRIWFAASDGISKLENGLFTRYESFLWGTKDVNGQSVDRNMQNITVGKNGTAYSYTSTGKVIRFANNIWTNVTETNKFNGEQKMRQDANGHLWVGNYDYSTQKGSIKIHDGSNWSSFEPKWSFINTSPPRVDNEGSFWYQTTDSIFVVKDKSSYKSIYSKVIGIHDANNLTTPIDLRFYMSPVYISGKKTYYFNGNSQYYIEHDGTAYRFRHLPVVSSSNISYWDKMFAVDKNDKVSFIQNSSAVHEFNRNNIIANFTDKQSYAGCNLKFRIGVFEPPTGNATTTKLKVMLSDGTASTFKDITATYSNGEITAKIPTNAVVGKGFRFKFTMGDNWYTSNESDAFEVLPAGNSTITGENQLCLGTALNLTASAAIGKAPYTFAWYNGSSVVGNNSNNLAVSKGGDYTVIATDANGCPFTSALTKITEKGILPTITPEGQTTVDVPNTVKLNANTAPNATYQWQKNGADIAGETKVNFEATESGDYTVVIKSDGCVGTSAALKITVNIINAVEPIFEALQVFPNPSAEQITVKFDKQISANQKLQLIDNKGVIVFQKLIESNEETISLQGISTGIYHVRIMDGKQVLSKKMVKIDR